MEMVQQVLSCCESLDSDLSVFLDTSESDYFVYIGLCLLERVSINPEDLHHKMLMGRLYNGGAKISLLRKRFNHDPRTIVMWANALKSSDIDEITKAFSGRSAQKKVIPALIAYVHQQYRNRATMGRNYRKIIITRTKEVFGVQISPSLASELFKGAKKHPDESESNTDEKDKNMEITGHSRPNSSSNSDTTVQPSPCFPFMTCDFLHTDSTLVQHAGLVLFGYALQGYDSFQRQVICQLLQGALNIESSKSLCADSLLFFCQKVDRVLRTQREKLDTFATSENILDLYAKNSTLLTDGPNNGSIFYFDPHSKKYTGQLKTMKGWCGSAHSVSKIVNLDSFHTFSGRPCYIQHFSPYYDMRERFFMSLKQFDLLFDEDKRSGRTFVIDRGIYGVDCFLNFVDDYLITWEKNYDGSGWEENTKTIDFSRSKQKNSRSSNRNYHFECQESAWRRDKRFRRIIVKSTNYNDRTITVSILCSNPTMSIQDAVWAICNRWLQENDFKYLDVHFGINQLDSRSHIDFKSKADAFTDRDADTGEYRKLKKQTNTAERCLAKHLLKLNKGESKLKRISLERTVLESRNAGHSELKKVLETYKRCEKSVGKLIGLTSDLERVLQAAELEQSKTLHKESRIKQLVDGSYKILDLRRKAYMDALRINAANIFRNQLEEYRAISNNYRDDHLRLRMLTRCSGLIVHGIEEYKVRLWIPGSVQGHVIKSLELLLSIVESNINEQTPPSSSKLKLELISGPIES